MTVNFYSLAGLLFISLYILAKKPFYFFFYSSALSASSYHYANSISWCSISFICAILKSLNRDSSQPYQRWNGKAKVRTWFRSFWALISYKYSASEYYSLWDIFRASTANMKNSSSGSRLISSGWIKPSFSILGSVFNYFYNSLAKFL